MVRIPTPKEDLLATHLDAGTSLEPRAPSDSGNTLSCSPLRGTGDSLGGLENQQLTRVKLFFIKH